MCSYDCSKCKDCGLTFHRKYKPKEYFLGYPNSRIWIIGLNPKSDDRDHNDSLTKDQLCHYFKNNSRVHSYFCAFKKVSQKLWEMLGKENGAGHTDLVKCYSAKWPPAGKDGTKVVENCREYLREQLQDSDAEIIICNGRAVCDEIGKIVHGNPNDGETYYRGTIVNTQKEVTVVLTGFIGRLHWQA